MQTENRDEMRPIEITPFMKLVDLWTFAEVAECSGSPSAGEIRGGGLESWYRDACAAAGARLKQEADTIRVPAMTAAARYVVAEFFEHFGDTSNALRVRGGGADELVGALAKLATNRLARALTIIAGPSLGEHEWGEFPNAMLTRMITKYFIAELIERFDSRVADELRSGSLESESWYWDVNDLIVDELRRTGSPLLGENTLDGPELSELFYAREHRCIAIGALKKLGVCTPEVWAVLGVPGNGSQEMESRLRASAATGVHRLMRDVAIADRLASAHAVSQEVVH